MYEPPPKGFFFVKKMAQSLRESGEQKDGRRVKPWKMIFFSETKKAMNGRGPTTVLRGLTITMVINHLS